MAVGGAAGWLTGYLTMKLGKMAATAIGNNYPGTNNILRQSDVQWCGAGANRSRSFCG